jgi:hypothetical protein
MKWCFPHMWGRVVYVWASSLQHALGSPRSTIWRLLYAKVASAAARSAAAPAQLFAALAQQLAAAPTTSRALSRLASSTR